MWTKLAFHSGVFSVKTTFGLVIPLESLLCLGCNISHAGPMTVKTKGTISVIWHKLCNASI
jgi:hypothetical protein